MLWVYIPYKYFNSFSAGIVFIHQNLQGPSLYVRIWCQILTYKDGPRADRVSSHMLPSLLQKAAWIKVKVLLVGKVCTLTVADSGCSPYCGCSPYHLHTVEFKLSVAVYFIVYGFTHRDKRWLLPVLLRTISIRLSLCFLWLFILLFMFLLTVADSGCSPCCFLTISIRLSLRFLSVPPGIPLVMVSGVFSSTPWRRFSTCTSSWLISATCWALQTLVCLTTTTQ